jgi:DNA polymerase alpha subunit A
MPDVPSAGAQKGILPQVIKRLLERRNAVKGMLKKETNTFKKQQLDIRQLALKLVANSMYGCLGFSASRFYCKPIAALVTSQGRSILQESKDLSDT